MLLVLQFAGFAGPYIVGRLSNQGGYRSTMRYFGGMSFAAAFLIVGAYDSHVAC